MKKLCIISLGWLGQELYRKLEGKYDIYGSYNNEPKGLLNEFKFDINSEEFPDEISDADIIFFNLPPSKITSLKRLNNFFISNGSKRIVMISSTSVYENEGISSEHTELVSKSERAKKQIDIENLLRENVENSLIIRCAGLYGKERHPGFYLSGKDNIIGGDDPINLVGLYDLMDLIPKLLETSTMKVLNAVNTNHPKKSEYYTDFCIRNEIESPNFMKGSEKNKIIKTIYDQFEINSELP